MPVTIHVNGSSNSLVHKGSNGIAQSTIPDVCKTPSPGGPVPVPYPVIVSMSSDLENGSTTVKADGGNMIAIKDCDFSKCTGDEAGTAGGVTSSTFGKEAKFILYSFDVKLDGGNACRLGDKMSMNHQNAMCLGGLNQPGVTVSELKDGLCQDLCDHENGAQAGKHRRKSDDLEKSCQTSGKYGSNVLFRQRETTPPGFGFSTKITKPDAITADKSQCFDFKLCGDRPRGDQVERQAAISGGAAPIIISCDECKKCNPSCKC